MSTFTNPIQYFLEASNYCSKAKEKKKEKKGKKRRKDGRGGRERGGKRGGRRGEESEEIKLKLYLYNLLCRRSNEICTTVTVTIK